MSSFLVEDDENEEIEEGEEREEEEPASTAFHHAAASISATSSNSARSLSRSRVLIKRKAPLQVTLKSKGRGFRPDAERRDLYADQSAEFDSYDTEPNKNKTSLVQKSVEGYIVIITNLHSETSEDDLSDAFGDFGPIISLQLPLDRRTGLVKGYALIEYTQEDEARRAVEEGDGMEVTEKTVKVDWAFKVPPWITQRQSSRPQRS